MFRGITVLNLDTKGRLAIPTRYRDRLEQSCGSQLVVTADKDRCLLIYPANEWVEVERAIRRLPSITEPGRSLQRLYIGHAQDTKMDGQGRILIPPELRDFASLDKKVVLVGQANKFELWDEAAWNKCRDESLENVINMQAQEDLPAELANLSL